MKKKHFDTRHFAERLSVAAPYGDELPAALAEKTSALALEGFRAWSRRRDRTDVSTRCCTAFVSTGSNTMMQAMTASPGTDGSVSVANVSHLIRPAS